MSETTTLDRRTFMARISVFGLGGTLFPGVLWARMQQAPKVTADMVAKAAELAGLNFTAEQRDKMVDGLNADLRAWRELHGVELPNAVAPAIHFNPTVPDSAGLASRAAQARRSRVGPVTRPTNLEAAAFWPVTKLAELIRTRQASSVELTRMYLSRLKRYGPKLQAVITFTEERAMEQARAADELLAAGEYRGPLHGIPWGAKDLLAVRGYPTTWGAAPYKDQVIDYDATVVKRLDEAGAVLIAKLALGALAHGDVWFGGETRNPWKPSEGSSGSSAGPAACTAAGLVGFSVGSETLGSIVSPCTRCGATGLRPTFGRVSRFGAMTLSWSMDKLGPICRAVEDCALVLEAIYGPDGRDLAVHDMPFVWDADVRPTDLRIGYYKSAFEAKHATAFDRATLGVLRRMGVTLVPVELPVKEYPVNAVRTGVLDVEAAAAFQTLTLSGRDKLMEPTSPRPNSFREANLMPAVEYVQASRVRTLLMEATQRALADIDVLVTPSFGGNVVTLTNLTGQPAVVVPNGFRATDGTPVSISFLGRLWQEGNALALAKAYQDATSFHTRTPPLFT